MKKIMESWRGYVNKEKLITEFSKRSGISEKKLREGVSRRDFLRGSTAVALSTLAACDIEYGITPVGPDAPTGGDFGDYDDTGTTTDGILWKDLPSCTQQCEWDPPPSDPRWKTGVPLEEFRVIGRYEELPFDQVGDYIGSAFTSDGDGDGVADMLMVWWHNVPDSCGFWSSEYNVWDFISDEEGLPDGMERVEQSYAASPLLRIHLNFDVFEEDGKYYLKEAEGVGGGGSLVPEKLDSECVQAYLRAINDTVESYESDSYWDDK